jgi:hypothetical protein
LPQLLNRGVDSVLEVDERVIRPQSGLKLFARDGPAFRFQKQPKHP